MYRRLVFETGYTTLCHCHQQNKDRHGGIKIRDGISHEEGTEDDDELSGQIGLSRDALIRIRYNLSHDIINCLLYHIHKLKKFSQTTSPNKFNDSVCEVLRTPNNMEEVFNITTSFLSEYIQIAIQHGYADKNRQYHNSYHELKAEFQSVMYIFNYIYQTSSKHLENTLQKFYRNVQQHESYYNSGKINNLFLEEIQENLNIMLSYLKDIKNTIEFYDSYDSSQKENTKIIQRYTHLAFEILNSKLDPVLVKFQFHSLISIQ